ncbi:MAG TPA: alpha/beta hydrolase [Beijerinckiaceae bacterium]|nr:alpha/beta hydrolase [Beijerinckiaceae bacterium]
MSGPSRGDFLAIAGSKLEWRLFGAGDPPEIVLLHEGLGCVGLWGDFPERLAARTGRSVLAYSRAGYGASSPVPLPRAMSYMHDEARHVLPALLDAIGFVRGVLVGHSDGASIATIHAGDVVDRRVVGMTLIAPHFFVEDISVAAIAEARKAYETSDLREKLARWHANVDNAFRGWNEAWLDPAFRHWDISACLETINCPVQVIQGTDDQYGTVRQVEVARARCSAPVETHLLPGVKHAPHREASETTLTLISQFIARHLG